MEARAGIEPANHSVADCSLTTWVPRPSVELVYGFSRCAASKIPWLLAPPQRWAYCGAMPLPRLYPRAYRFLEEGRALSPLAAGPNHASAARTVRPGLRRHAPTQAAASRQLEQMADAALLRVDPSGALRFEVAIEDVVLGPLTCHIVMADRRVSAFFYSATVETYRLLTAESGRLRVMLAERGLRLGEVRVLEGSPDGGHLPGL